MEQKIRFEVHGITGNNEKKAYAVILVDKAGARRLPIAIGLPEAQSIAVCLEGCKTPRPLTHDLFTSFALSFNIDVTEVVVDKLQDGIFYSKLVCSQDGTRIEIDARTSDAIALALRFKCPIFVYSSVFNEALASLSATIEANNVKLEELDTNTLSTLLQKAIDTENYELASKIRDIILSRN